MEYDEQIRKQLSEKLVKNFKRRVSFSGNARSGEAIYQDGDKTLRFYMEMGGGDCLFYLAIPDTVNWEKQTGIPLAGRDEILQFVAGETLRQQASSGAYFVIEERFINFWKKQKP